LTETIFSRIDRKQQQQMAENLYGQGLGEKRSHLGLVCNLACIGGFRAWKSHEILTWNFFSEICCQTTTNWPKKGSCEGLGEKPSHFGLVYNFIGFSWQR